MAFLDLGEGILSVFADAQGGVTFETATDIAALRMNSFSIHDPYAAQRRFRAMQQIRGKCTKCGEPANGKMLCKSCTAGVRHKQRVARLGENYLERTCKCGCGKNVLPNRQYFDKNHKNRDWARKQAAAEAAARGPVVEAPCRCGCGELVRGKKFVNDTHKVRYHQRNYRAKKREARAVREC